MPPGPSRAPSDDPLFAASTRIRQAWIGQDMTGQVAGCLTLALSRASDCVLRERALLELGCQVVSHQAAAHDLPRRLQRNRERLSHRLGESVRRSTLDKANPLMDGLPPQQEFAEFPNLRASNDVY